MTLAEQATLDLLNAIADVPLTFTFGGTDYEDAATRGALISRKHFGDGGFLEQPDLSITTTRKKLNAASKLVDRFADDTPPVVNEKLTIDDVIYRIEAVHSDEFNVGLQFDLESQHKGAL